MGYKGVSMGPISRTEAVDLSGGDVTLARPARAINVEGGGVVAFANADGVQAPVCVAPGIWFPIEVSRILQAGTTATGIVAGD